MADKPQGTGSVWNINSWHWEQKNYTEPAKELIKKKIENQVYEYEGITIILDKLAKITGDAQINIRKGKQILCYSFDLEIDWSGENVEDNANGSIKINDFNESDMDFEISSITVKEKTKISDKAKEFFRKQFKAEFTKIFSAFNQDLSSYESDAEKIEKDKKMREEAIEKTKKAQQEKGAEKERIFEEQKLKEEKLKEEFSKVK